MRKGAVYMTATEFKARCLAVFTKLEKRQYARVLVTRRGRPVAELIPPRTTVPDPWGALRGRVTVPPDVDLTAPVLGELLDARRGRLHR